MKRIAVLGSTGSIGKSTLQVVQHLPQRLRVTALAAHSNSDLLAQQIEIFQPEIVCIYQKERVSLLKSRFPGLNIVSGPEGLEEIASHASVDYVVMAIAGMQALRPTIAAIKAKKQVGLATKEVLVSAGSYITSLLKESNLLLPIDSEHSALFQCLQGRTISEVKRIILTASGGPFRSYSKERLSEVTVEEALAHPTWNMGPKVTIDCSTLLNKGLEMIEARWLFGIPPEKIEVVVHPQSLIHSFVEFIDGTLLAQMHEPNMIYPIQYALTYPEREKGMFPSFDFFKHQQLTFMSPDYDKFPGLRLAEQAMKEGRSYPAYLNAANEVLVERFLNKEISWHAIASLLERLLSRHRMIAAESLEAIMHVDHEAREEARTAA